MYWLGIVGGGKTELEFERLCSDQGFLVYVTQAYPGMKPYLKGFNLSLETWREGRDEDGWKLQPRKPRDINQEEEKDNHKGKPEGMESVKIKLVAQTAMGEENRGSGPPSGITKAVPRFKEDLEAILELASGGKPALRCVQSKRILTAYYSFGDASLADFGSTIQRPSGVHSRFGLWVKDEEDKSSNYRELRNLVDTVKEEASKSYLKNSKLWLFTDNSTAKSCFYKGGLSSKLLHELILRLKKAKICHGFILHLVHVAGTQMIAQGTDGFSRGSFLEGVLAGRDMLAFVDVSLPAIQ
jgi:hypothetical protein